MDPSFTIGEMTEIDRSQHLHDLVLNFLFAEFLVADLQRECCILEYIHMRPDCVGLEYHAKCALVRCNENIAC